MAEFCHSFCGHHILDVIERLFMAGVLSNFIVATTLKKSQGIHPWPEFAIVHCGQGTLKKERLFVAGDYHSSVWYGCILFQTGNLHIASNMKL